MGIQGLFESKQSDIIFLGVSERNFTWRHILDFVQLILSMVSKGGNFNLYAGSEDGPQG
jgi:hypothetical protein